MNKTTKGAFAASAAAVLLLGGAGSLAYWSDTDTLTTGKVTAGNLTLNDAQCDEAWTYAGKANNGEPVLVFVPGDTITKTCTFVVKGSGDNLKATLTTPDTFGVSSSKGALKATVGATYAIAGKAVPATITSANDGDVVTATLNISFPFGDSASVNANDMQDTVATFDDITVNLTQTAPNA